MESSLLCGVVAGITCAALLATMPSQASAEGDSSSPFVTVEDFEMPESTLDRPQAVQDALTAANELYEFNKNLFLGAYFNRDTGRPVIVASSDAGVELATKALLETGVDVVIENAKVSDRDLDEIAERIKSLSPTFAEIVVGWNAAPEDGGIRLLLSRPIAEERQLLERFASSIKVPVTLLVTDGLQMELTDTRDHDPSPYAGGMRYAVANGSGSGASLAGRCSSAFGVKADGKRYVLTAGHCFPRNRSNNWMWIFSGPNAPVSGWLKQQYGGKKAGSTWKSGEGTVNAGQDSAKHGDLARVNVTGPGRKVGGKIWWGTSTTSSKIPVIGRRAPQVGDPLAFGGATSGSDRGQTVYKVNTRIDTDGGAMRQGDIAISFSAFDCPQRGDSGGSVILDTAGAEDTARAVGVVSSATSGTIGQTYVPCVMGFTGVEEAIQAWGGAIATN